MNSSIIKQGQSFVDKVTQLTGSLENALKMAILNNRPITDPCEIGLVIKGTEVTNKRVAGYFTPFNEPATALTNLEVTEIENTGIGIMVIGTTFKVASNTELVA